MKSFITPITVALALSASTGTAVALPAVDSPGSASGGTASAAQASFEAPAQPSQGGTGALTIVLLGTGGVLALAGAGSVGARVARRPHRIHTTSGV